MKTLTTATKFRNPIYANFTIPLSNIDLVDLDRLTKLKPRRDKLVLEINNLLSSLNEIDEQIAEALPSKVQLIETKTKTVQATKATKVKGHGITLGIITDILKDNPQGLTVPELVKISSELVGFEMGYERIKVCLNTKKRFYRSRTVPYKWHVDVNA